MLSVDDCSMHNNFLFEIGDLIIKSIQFLVVFASLFLHYFEMNLQFVQSLLFHCQLYLLLLDHALNLLSHLGHIGSHR